MRTIETTAVVGTDHSLTGLAPAEVTPGTVRVLIVVENEAEIAPSPIPRVRIWNRKPHNVGLVDPSFTFRREDLYGDDGR